MEKKIYAHFDNEGIYVYQAFKPEIVAAALENGTFSKGFNMERMTWIKPSFAWMLYRSGYASKHRQEAILKIKICHEGFIEILKNAVPTTYDSNLFSSKESWSDTLKKSSVRYQWDPDRDLSMRKIDRRAIQLGIRGDIVKRYVNEWIIGLEEVTSLAHEIKNSLSSKKRPTVPTETVYKIHDEKIRQHMQIEEQEMQNNNLTTKNIYTILLPLVFVTIHEICFFGFLWFKHGFSKAMRINTSFMKWLQFIKTADLDYFLVCWLVPILVTIIVTYVLVLLLQRSAT